MPSNNWDMLGIMTKQKDREEFLLKELNWLTTHHRSSCPAYNNIVRNIFGNEEAKRIIDVPYLPVSLFKRYEFLSVDKSKVIRVLTSSGTTGQAVSKIFLDDETAKRQSTALISIMSNVLGSKRMPMMILDTKDVLKNPTAMSARGAGIVGLMNFGARPFFALNEDMSLDKEGVLAFMEKNGNAPFFMFGFTFMVWCYFYQQIKDLGINLSNGTLIHSGGWKKMIERKVDNVAFKTAFLRDTGLSRIHNFYGMVEQIGSIYIEGNDGYLYAHPFSDVIIRDPVTMKEAKIGQPGIIQVVSCLPRSYPGHSILTEDIGVVHHIDQDTCGRMGKAFSVLGRIPKAEVRGCSDTHATEVSE